MLQQWIVKAEGWLENYGVVRNHIWVVPVVVCTVYYLTAWLIRSEMVMSFSESLANTQMNLPRVYLSDSNWFDRSIDVFRTVLGGFEIIEKGYKMVSTSTRISIFI
jgi:hypothetical protein